MTRPMLIPCLVLTLAACGDDEATAALSERLNAQATQLDALQATVDAQAALIQANTDGVAGLEGVATLTAEDLEGYLTQTDLDGVATEAWVQAQDYAMASDLADLRVTAEAELAAATTTAQSNSAAIGDNAADIAANSAAIGDNTGDITDLLADTAGAAEVLTYLSADTSSHEVFFSGANVNIRNGTGSSDGAKNGLGNLVVGYNEDDGTSTRTGSHNIVSGMQNSYTGWGGYVGGYHNTISARGAVILSGSENVASSRYAFIGTCWTCSASGVRAAVLGGEFNDATTQASSIVGGYGNVVSGNWSSIGGGRNNEVSGEVSTIVGGYYLTEARNFSVQ